jgi:phosphoribosyl 1,2-cyclic phosphate phosphodiesterase
MRLRSCARIRVAGKELLIDATPDFRQQALRNHVPFPNGLLITHTHYDHVGGLEELRAYNIHTQQPIHCFLSKGSYESVKKLLYYHFVQKTEEKHFSASFHFHVLEEPEGLFDVHGLSIEYFSYLQGAMPVTGFRFGSLAYITDIKEYDPSIFSHLHNLDVLVLSAAWVHPSVMQMTIQEALEFRAKVGAKRTYFIHLSHDIEYHKESASLPSDVALAYDGMEIEFVF